MINKVSNWLQQRIRSPYRNSIVLGLAVLIFQLYSATKYPNIAGVDSYIRLVNYKYLLVGHWLPGLQLLVKAAVSIDRSGLLLMFLLAAITGLTVVVFYAMCRLVLKNNLAALLAALALSTTPFFLLLSRFPYQETLALLFISSAIYLLEKNKINYSSVFYMGACLIRQEAWFLLPVFLWRLKNSDRVVGGKKWFFVVGPILGVLFAMLPLVRAPFDPLARHITFGGIFNHPAAYFVGVSTQQFVGFLIDHLFLVIVALWGMVTFFKNNFTGRPYLFIAPIIFTASFFNGFNWGAYAPRNFMLSVYFLIPWICFDLFGKKYYGGSHLFRIRVFLVVLFIVTNCLSFFIYVVFKQASFNNDLEPYRNLGVFLQTNLNESDRVLAVYKLTGPGERALIMRGIFYSGYDIGETYTTVAEEEFKSLVDLKFLLGKTSSGYLLVDRLSEEKLAVIDSLVGSNYLKLIYTDLKIGLSLYEVDKNKLSNP